EPQPDRREMADEGGEAGEHGAVLAAQRAAEQHRRRTLEGVTEKGEAGERLVAGAQDIGCADIAGADGADIAEPAEAGQEQAEGDRAEQIAGGNGGEKPRIGEVEMHAAKAPVLRRSGGSVFIDG